MSIIPPTTHGDKPFCEISSESVYSSNLQLFSLRQAYRYLKELHEKECEGSKVTEYLVFIIVCAGTSISQLLGQNVKHSSTSTKVPPPKRLFDEIFGNAHSKAKDFEAFIDLYDDCRHFGSPKYPSIKNLTIEKCECHLNLVTTLWDEIVEKYRNENDTPQDDLKDFDTVLNLVCS